ncbi:class I SAM-dependent RNA methyltransferase [Fodinicurvata halophila]|uniref:class I SAM-dependent RNA methyltransferase n=1 Tax=Fodinicurvata halophila TaxID=1419723 RepID=UPI00363C6573
MGRRARKGGGRQAVVEIEALGGRGDGVATLEGRPVFVPVTLPGDRLRVRLTAEKAGGWRGEPLELLEEGPDRMEPPCRHFGPCGGCQLQHLSKETYDSWKRNLLVQALSRADVQAGEIGPLRQVSPRTRRRALLAARPSGDGVELGFRERFSHRIVALKECHILTPSLFSLCRTLKKYLQPFLEKDEIADLYIAEVDNGFDVLLSGVGAPDLEAREVFANPERLPEIRRFAWREASDAPVEPVVERSAPEVRFGEVIVRPPPGAFLQPTADGEKLLVETVLEGVPATTGSVLDLFSGCGTFTFHLAQRASVRAVEGESTTLSALQAAANGHGLAGRVQAEHRDLFRQPLRPEELNGFDVVVFDPRAAVQRNRRRIWRTARCLA